MRIRPVAERTQAEHWPSVYRCFKAKKCGHYWDAPEGSPTTGKCPKCGGLARLRCGSPPRPTANRETPCFRLTQKWGVRCERHGARSPKGMANGQWKHGRRSRYLPAAMREVFEEALTDKDLYTLRITCALLDVRRVELMKQLNGEQGQNWGAVRKSAAELRDALHGSDIEAAQLALGRLEVALSEGEAQEAVWRRLLALEDQHARTVNVEARRMAAEQGVVPLQAHTALVYAMTALLREFLSPAQHTEFSRRLRQLGGETVN